MFNFVKADIYKFAVFHTIYTASNIFDRFDWNERVDDAVDCISNKNAYFVYENEILIGGFTLKDNHLNYPFIVTPFDDRKMFWGTVLDYAVKISGNNEIYLNEIPEADTNVLLQFCDATLRWSKQRMLRPTEQCAFTLDDNFYFDNLTITDIKEIISVIYEAHSDGHTSTVWKPDMAEIETAVQRRFESFGKTNTLYMSNTVKNKEDDTIVAVCIAGIYPDSETYSTGNFATIHQISVKPEYRRKGIAKAMMLKSINDASNLSPAITLGVLKNNPAEKLYKEIGFRAGESYSELHFTRQSVLL
jgi:ribosomal protein S18 acetylase RimI-like enzyme